MDNDKKGPGNYLAFDGGLSGLPGLCILEELISRLQFDLNSDAELFPWHYFKVISGTGPGGLIAIFVGRMKMTVSEAIEAYTRLLPVLSVPPAKDEEERRGNTEKFKLVFLEILEEIGCDATTPFVDEGGAKTIVCTLNPGNPTAVHLIRSYRSRSAPRAACTILEVACACVASPDTFLPVTIGTGLKQVSLIDATTGFANPSQELLREAQRVFGSDEEVATLVSIGAGKGDVWSLTEGVSEEGRLKAFQRITMNCEPVHEELWGRLRETGIYYRLNVDRSSGPQMQLSSAHITEYLQEGEISEKLDNAIGRLHHHHQQRPDGVKLKDINSVTVIKTQLKPRPSLVQNFTGREDILQAMHRTHFTPRFPESDTPAITVLSGLGGSGKTQISLKFAKDFEKTVLNAPVFFLDADSEESLKKDYETLIRSLGPEHRSKSHKDALVWLATKLNNWLIILDNADNPKMPLFPYIPKCASGNVIITTRNSNHASLALNSTHHIEGLSEAESVSLILSSSGYEHTETNQLLATDIVRELSHLPLALAQAAGYIFVNKCLPRYLEIYRKGAGEILASFYSQRLDDYKSSVAATIEISLAQLPQEARDVLRLFAYLNSTSIPLGIIARAAERQFEHVTWTKKSKLNPETLKHASALRKIFYKDKKWSEIYFNEIITHCLQYSLLQITTQGTDSFYSMHLLVQSYLRVSSSHIQGYRPGQLVVRLLGSSFTYCAYYEYLPFNRLLLPHIRLIQLEDVVEAGDDTAFGRISHETGDGALSLAYRERCVKVWKESLGEEHQNTLGAMTNLAISYKGLERTQDAIELEERVLVLDRKLLGAEHEDTLVTMSNLAVSYKSVGREEEAKIIEQKVWKMRREVLGPEHIDTLATINNLATSYSELEETKIAMKLTKEVLEIQRRLLEPDHPDTLTSMHNLANFYVKVGRETEAMQLREWVADSMMRVLGSEHPDTMQAMWNLGCSYSRLGLTKKLMKLVQTAVSLDEMVWRPDAVGTMQAGEEFGNISIECEGNGCQSM